MQFLPIRGSPARRNHLRAGLVNPFGRLRLSYSDLARRLNHPMLLDSMRDPGLTALTQSNSAADYNCQQNRVRRVGTH
jgi:hypothetical protein